MRQTRWVLKGELAEVLGIGRVRVGELIRYEQLPQPTGETVGGAPLWQLGRLEAWNATRKPGKPPLIHPTRRR